VRRPEPLEGSILPPAARSTQPAGPTPGLRNFRIPLAPPTITYTLIFANIAMFVATLIYGYVHYRTLNGSQDVNVLIDMGAKVNEYIALGEYWRLLSAMFLHIGVLHLLFNLYALYIIGTLIEGYFGHLRFAVIYGLGGLFGSLGSYAFSESVSAGASGAIFAITGAAAVYFFRYRDNFGAHGRAVLQNIVLVIVINMAFGIAGRGVDNWGHFGGLVGGVLLAWGLLPRYQAPAPAPLVWQDGMIVPRGVALSPQAQAMEIVHRPLVEATWVALVTLLFAAGVWGATSMHMARLEIWFQ
jgi:rhomboid protease GluP